MKTKIKSFAKSTISYPLPSLIFMQQESWRQFWEEELKDLFTEVSPIKDYTGKEFELDFLNYELGKPNYPTGFAARENNDSYEAPLRVNVRLKNLKTKRVQEQEIFFGNFPILTDKGTFILNGVERVVISQLTRSPGVFFPLNINKGKRCFAAKIIPNRGSWLEFETEATGVINVKIDRKRKVSAVTLLKALGGYNDDDIRQMFTGFDNGEVSYIEETIKKDITNSQEEALLEIYQRLRAGEMSNPDAAKELIFNMFFNFDRYDLSRVGRWKMWSRVPGLKPKKEIEIGKEERVLSVNDIVAVIKEIIRLNNDPRSVADVIDHLGNRRVKTISELLSSKLRVGISRMARIIKDRMSTLEFENLSPSQLINPRPFSAQVAQFFTASQFSQFMDNTNPLSELEHKRRLTATGPGGLTRERAGFDVRDVQPSHYGRICPIQTPEGPNVGLVTHLSLYARLNSFGFIDTPYFKVKNAKVTDEAFYMDANEEERYNIAPASILIDNKNNISQKRVEARLKGDPGEIERENIDYVDVSPQQFTSVSTSLIPFLQNDDANRAQMGSNMQRQAVPLVNPEAPLVGTGLEPWAARDSGQLVFASEAGKVVAVDANEVQVKGTTSGKIKTYFVRNFDRTNQYSCLHQRPVVDKGDMVKKGDILIEGGSIDKQRLSLGRNLLVSFISWKGNTYEDAIVLSDRLVKEDFFTSVHIEDFFCDVRETKLGPEITTSDIPNVGEEKLKDLDEEGIIRVGAEVGPNDILVGKISPKGEADLSAEERLLRAIFGDKAKEVKDTSLRAEHGKRGRVTDVKVFSREAGYSLEPGVIKKIRIRISEVRKIQVGDKLAGRHGNKGIIAKILPVEEMPFLEDGTPVDIILNPLSVASRMNLGQILETHLGLAVHKLGYLAETPSLSGATEEDIMVELKEAGYPEDGKLKLYDPETGECFPERITVGYIYMIKLAHMVEDKIHMRSIGPYSLITQQPLGGKAQFGGQRFGEMEVWALEGYGAAYTLQEMLTIKSDDVAGRAATYEAILKGEKIKSPNIPASFNLLLSELKALSLNVIIKGKIEEED
ncbi:MAG: DNA-directed RNA polymerase subunit beta [Candidatus Pacebacteria bacterium]|nr:DNA-directed RNA polymerase subunit beta [Candidatus Paceibacterota bacterium]MDD4074152.1 DNA-directed RNA polymerase subunit beta [Candidatus Paceibacterota bacterium]